jgi:P-type E1-E2 ATPase
MNAETTRYVEAESMLGRTTVIVAEDSEAGGIISIADTPRKGVENSISQMKSNGARKIVMLTGDNFSAAKEIARQVGIDEVHANLLPEDKVKHVEALRDQGHRVIVVGDGINDAPALATADVGVSMGIAGTDVTMETAGIVLMTDDLSKVGKTMMLSRKVLSVIRQNVVFSIVVNVTGLLLSTQGFVSPVLASVIHESNALIVVFNSLRLLRSHLLQSEISEAMH